jgi:cytochrome c
MRFSALLALFTLACASTMTPRHNSHDDVVAYVDRAANVVRDHGPSCDTFARPEWKSGDWYIFVLERDGRTICHPAKPELVGTMVTDVADANGKRIGDEFVRVASARGGWVDYVWPRPGQTTPVAKSSYVRLVDGPGGKSYIVGSGGYELK